MYAIINRKKIIAQKKNKTKTNTCHIMKKNTILYIGHTVYPTQYYTVPDDIDCPPSRPMLFETIILLYIGNN